MRMLHIDNPDFDATKAVGVYVVQVPPYNPLPSGDLIQLFPLSMETIPELLERIKPMCDKRLNLKGEDGRIAVMTNIYVMQDDADASS